MDYKPIHGWDVSPEEAIELQKKLRDLVVLKPFPGYPRSVAGVDLSFPKPDEGLAVIVVLEFPSFRIAEVVHERGKVSFPYIPGLLAFREGPLFLLAWKKLRIKPDLVIFDGQGLAHPRKLGIASHMGLFIELPTIGVAKSKLFGNCVEPEDVPNAVTHVHDEAGKTIGFALRTKKGAPPIFVSPGHLINLEDSLRLVREMTLPGQRLPEPTRLAHIYTQRLKSSLF